MSENTRRLTEWIESGCPDPGTHFTSGPEREIADLCVMARQPLRDDVQKAIFRLNSDGEGFSDGMEILSKIIDPKWKHPTDGTTPVCVTDIPVGGRPFRPETGEDSSRE